MADIDVTELLAPLQFGNVTGGNFTEIELDGTLESHGDATAWDDQQVELSGAQLHPTSTPTWIDYKGGMALQFDDGSTETIFFLAQLSHRRKDDSDIDFHVHQTQVDALTGNVRWVFTYSWASLDGTFPAETTVAILAACDGVADKHMYRDVADPIVGTGKGISSMLICSLTRDGGHVDDTYAGDILLLAADFHMLLDTLGSRGQTVK